MHLTDFPDQSETPIPNISGSRYSFLWLHEIATTLREELHQAHEWLSDHKLSLDLKKTKIVFFGTAAKLPKIDKID